MRLTVRVGVLASGRGSNFMALLEAERRGELAPGEVVVLASDVTEAPVMERATERGIDAVLIPQRLYPSREAADAAMAEALRRRGVELVVLAGYMRVLSAGFVEAFADRIINVHPSLLPIFPGVDAIGEALRHGVKVTGVTVHFVDKGVDTGPIILQEAVAIAEGESHEALEARLHAVEHRLLPRAVQLVAAGKTRLVDRRVVIDE